MNMRPPVEQDVNASLLHALLVAAPQHGEEVLDVAVDVAVRKKADEMHGLATRADLANELLPFVALEYFAAFDGHLDALCALIEDTPCSEGVVPNLAVAHVVVTGQADSRAVCAEPGR